MSTRRTDDDRQLELFRARSAGIAARDAQDLMSWPFFSLAKSRRVTPIDFRMGDVSIRVEATAEHGMATIWDADILIWAASQIVDARDNAEVIARESNQPAPDPAKLIAPMVARFMATNKGFSKAKRDPGGWNDDLN